MTISALSTVFLGSVEIRQATVTAHTVRVDTLYSGKLGKLTDPSLLAREIKIVTNNPGSVARDGLPFLLINI